MDRKKIKIQKGSVQETLLIPLYGRKLAMDMYPVLFHDQDAQKLFEQIECEFDMQSKLKRKMGAIMGATRQYDMACVCKEYLKEHPNACVVNLGCGLDTTFRQVDNGTAKGYNIDFPDTIQVREEFLHAREREKNIPSDLMDFSWFDKLDYHKEEGIVFFASGVFYYFKREDEQELKEWNTNFKKVVRKGYMTGYRPLDKRYGCILNIVFRLVDKIKKCQMIEITFED